jgi:hypothetical protein
MKTINGNKSDKNKEGESDIIGRLAWYHPEQWARLLEVSVDRDSLEKTHDEWLCLAEKAMFDFKRTGISPQKVYIDIEELIAWCKVKKRPVNAAARAEFAQILLKRKMEAG